MRLVGGEFDGLEVVNGEVLTADGPVAVMLFDDGIAIPISKARFVVYEMELRYKTTRGFDLTLE